jgi:hypothetical protein
LRSLLTPRLAHALHLKHVKRIVQRLEGLKGSKSGRTPHVAHEAKFQAKASEQSCAHLGADRLALALASDSILQRASMWVIVILPKTRNRLVGYGVGQPAAGRSLTHGFPLVA